MTLDGGDAVTIEWPEGIAELEEFVRSKGLYFACQGPVPHSGRRDTLAVRK